MSIEPLAILHTGVFLAVVAGLYGLVVGVVWSPFLFSGRIRWPLVLLPPAWWQANYLQPVGHLGGRGIRRSATPDSWTRRSP